MNNDAARSFYDRVGVRLWEAGKEARLAAKIVYHKFGPPKENMTESSDNDNLDRNLQLMDRGR